MLHVENCTVPVRKSWQKSAYLIQCNFFQIFLTCGWLNPWIRKASCILRTLEERHLTWETSGNLSTTSTSVFRDHAQPGPKASCALKLWGSLACAHCLHPGRPPATGLSGGPCGSSHTQTQTHFLCEVQHAPRCAHVWAGLSQEVTLSPPGVSRGKPGVPHAHVCCRHRSRAWHPAIHPRPDSAVHGAPVMAVTWAALCCCCHPSPYTSHFLWFDTAEKWQGMGGQPRDLPHRLPGWRQADCPARFSRSQEPFPVCISRCNQSHSQTHAGNPGSLPRLQAGPSLPSPYAEPGPPPMAVQGRTCGWEMTRTPGTMGKKERLRQDGASRGRQTQDTSLGLWCIALTGWWTRCSSSWAGSRS
ncbi:magnesium transporter NIPA2 isoform X2 [Fukomys damarensis]|uniref:magnesium transporter NIPA2 isoform X2 n=1 Tax=Fukomys damarensis TaxID=885580 RepID=UPI0014557B79|nr:magnesium transporter NIPA2 isoform X2 [Fukomys damarensis]XP_033616927.1 magnesium transporter NIPA2 isoform X2 [Fukomys damarensis]XP_033616928.1 magnesium transporter NIPA2 isoform X2 [Fukomys damarensis]XP_033616929.1 magnesium transporter NIPA2 isoform X2 [Fukomys damarensis]XP_033616930.1 magnesium transporter NIPA2 isoform X2 [Fukomys damarensis]